MQKESVKVQRRKNPLWLEVRGETSAKSQKAMFFFSRYFLYVDMLKIPDQHIMSYQKWKKACSGGNCRQAPAQYVIA